MFRQDRHGTVWLESRVRSALRRSAARSSASGTRFWPLVLAVYEIARATFGYHRDGLVALKPPSERHAYPPLTPRNDLSEDDSGGFCSLPTEAASRGCRATKLERHPVRDHPARGPVGFLRTSDGSL